MKHAADYAAKFKGGTGTDQSGGYYYLAAGARRSMCSLCLKPQGAVIAINLEPVSQGPGRAATHTAQPGPQWTIGW
jgi:hypothetical protein